MHEAMRILDDTVPLRAIVMRDLCLSFPSRVDESSSPSFLHGQPTECGVSCPSSEFAGCLWWQKARPWVLLSLSLPLQLAVSLPVDW